MSATDWLASADGLAEQGVVQKIVATGGKGVSFDAREPGGWDSTLLVFIESLRHAARERGVPFDDTGLPPAASRLLALAAEAAPAEIHVVPNSTLIAGVGRAAIDSGDEAAAVRRL
jgi:hypothetical protein